MERTVNGYFILFEKAKKYKYNADIIRRKMLNNDGFINDGKWLFSALRNEFRKKCNNQMRLKSRIFEAF